MPSALPPRLAALCLFALYPSFAACALSRGTTMESAPAEVDVWALESLGVAGRDVCTDVPCDQSRLIAQPELPPFAPVGDGYKRLVELAWEMAGKREGYRCARITLSSDIHITGLSPLLSDGVHGIGLEVEPNPVEPDRVYECRELAIGAYALPGAGMGTRPYALPEGVAFHVPAGHQLILHVHLVNTGDAPTRGMAGMGVRIADHADHAGALAEYSLAGLYKFEVPPGQQVISTRCEFPHATRLLGVLPRMHALGTRIKVEQVRGDGAETVLDARYDHRHQQVTLLDTPIELGPDALLQVSCYFDNDTGDTVVWGDGLGREQCLLGLHISPPIGLAPYTWCF